MLFFPIIFTSSIGLIKNDGMVGKVNNNGISQTPQAFLDCQVMDNEEGLFINWDIRNGIFEEGVIQDIFCTFLTYLKKISESVEFWNQQANVELPEKQMDQRKNVNSTFKEIKMDTLQNLFLKSALEMPKKTAVVDECGEHTYEELLWTAYGIADELQKCSCKAGDYVGIKLNKSFFQIASVLGTLLIGAAFVPIDNDQPEIRADKILEIAKIKCLIGEKEETHKYREKYKWIEDLPLFNYLFSNKNLKIGISYQPLVMYRDDVGISTNKKHVRNLEFEEERLLLEKRINVRKHNLLALRINKTKNSILKRLCKYYYDKFDADMITFNNNMAKAENEATEYLALIRKNAEEFKARRGLK